MKPAGENLAFDSHGLRERYREAREPRLRPRGHTQDLGHAALSRASSGDEDGAVASWAAECGYFAAYACPYPHGGIRINQNSPLHHFTWAMQIEHELASAMHPLDPLGRAIAAHGLPAA